MERQTEASSAPQSAECTLSCLVLFTSLLERPKPDFSEIGVPQICEVDAKRVDIIGPKTEPEVSSVHIEVKNRPQNAFNQVHSVKNKVELLLLCNFAFGALCCESF